MNYGRDVRVVMQWGGEFVDNLTRKKTNEIFLAGAKEIAALIKTNAPESLKMPVSAKRRRGSNITGVSKFDIVIGEGIRAGKTNVAVPAHIEFGTRYTEPWPFMYPAYDTVLPQILSRLQGCVD